MTAPPAGPREAVVSERPIVSSISLPSRAALTGRTLGAPGRAPRLCVNNLKQVTLAIANNGDADVSP